MSIADKLSYLNDTKEGLRIAINQLGGRLTKTTPFRNYADGLNYLYSKIPKVEAEGENITFNDVASALMKLDLKGNTSQSGTPTPSSPIPVSIVSGDNDVVVCGKNLLNLTQFTTRTLNGITFTKNSDGSITLNGTATSEITLDTPISINLSSGTSYIISQGTIYSGANYAISMRNQDYSVVTDTSIDSSLASKQFTFSSTTQPYYFRIFVVNGKTFNNHTIYPMIRYATTTDYTYEPYQSQTYPIDLIGNNLFKGTLYNGIINQGGTYISNANRITNADSSTMKTFILKKGTYTLSIENIDGCTIVIENESGSVIQEFADSWKTLPYTFTTTNDGYFYFSAKKNNDSALTPSDYKPMLNKGTTALPYEDNWEIELCKIGTYQDYFTKNSDGQWCKYNAIGKVVLDENSYDGRDGLAQSGTYRYFVKTTNSLAVSGSNTYQPLFSNIGIPISRNTAWTGGNGYSYTNNIGIIQMSFDETRTLSIDGFKVWLNTNKPILYYILATPYLSLIEDNNLIEQLDNLENAMSYEGTTNIGQVNNDKAFIISAKALTEIVFEGGE